MILASAQTKPQRFNTEINLSDLYRFSEAAAQKGADLIAFPEMAITGYERANAHEMAFLPGDKRLDALKKLAVEKKIIIIAGAPILVNGSLFIGSFILKPDGSELIYTKQFLHGSEADYFSSSVNFNPKIELNGELISPAICADIDHVAHAENASRANSTIYIPSIFFSPGGIPGAYSNLSSYAKNFSMNILMSNFCGESFGSPSGGGSAFWNTQGELVANLNDKDAGLLIIEKSNHSWRADCIYM